MYVRVGRTRYREIVVAVLQMTRGGYSREKKDVCIGAANVSCNWWNGGVVVSIDRDVKEDGEAGEERDKIVPNMIEKKQYKVVGGFISRNRNDTAATLQ